MIGQKGTVLGFNTQLGRYLVRFDEPVQALGLHGHNPEPNSLYILGADLLPLDGADARPST